jgi:hypothetical protein
MFPESREQGTRNRKIRNNHWTVGAPEALVEQEVLKAMHRHFLTSTTDELARPILQRIRNSAQENRLVIG